MRRVARRSAAAGAARPQPPIRVACVTMLGGGMPKIPILSILASITRFRLNPLKFLDDAGDGKDIVVFEFGSYRTIAVYGSEQIRHVLQTHYDRYRKNYGSPARMVGRSILVVSGEEWERRRALAQPAFSSQATSQFMPELDASVDRMLEDWRRQAAKGRAVDVKGSFRALFVELVCRILFGSPPPRDPRKIQADIFRMASSLQRRALSLTALGKALAMLSSPRYFQAKKRWRDLPSRLLDSALSAAEPALLPRRLAEAIADPSWPEFGSPQAQDEVRTYLVAGSETTASVLTWALYLVSRHPEVADRIRGEIARVCNSRSPTADDVPRLDYVGWTINETMRLYPPVWHLTRIAKTKDEISGHAIHEGDTLCLCLYSLFRDRRYWTRPDEFWPERFADQTEATRWQSVFLPFGAGPRACIGSHLAVTESVVVLARILQKVDLFPTKTRPARISSGVTLWPRGRLNLRVVFREDAVTPPA